MRAHGGRVNIRVPREKVLRIELTLPMETSS
jgi:hypothetical protein